METVRYHRIPTNWRIPTTWTQRSVTRFDLQDQIDYDKRFRWGQSLFVDGKCVHVGFGHTPEDIVQIEAVIAQQSPVRA